MMCLNDQFFHSKWFILVYFLITNGPRFDLTWAKFDTSGRSIVVKIDKKQSSNTNSCFKLLYFYPVLIYTSRGSYLISGYCMISYLVRDSVLSGIVMLGITEIHLLVV